MNQHTIEEIKRNLPDLKVHPSNNTPRMIAQKLEALKMDILLAGKLHRPIWLRDGELFDGKNRYEACQQLKEEGRLAFEPDIKEWPFPDDDANAVFDSLNLHQNHLTSNQVAVYIAKHRLEALKFEADGRMRNGNREIPMELIPQGKKGTAYEIAAFLYGSNPKYIQYANEIKEANVHFLDFVMSKQMSLKEGMSFIKLDDDERNFMFAQMKAGITYKKAYEQYQEQAKQEQKPKLKKKKTVDVPNLIFTSPVHEEFLDKVIALYREYHPDRNIPACETWDVEQNEELATKISNVSKFNQKSGK